MSRDSKKLIAAVAALQIILYHCWIPVFRYGTAAGNIERFLVAATYPAVDVYFFISAYTLASRPVEDYAAFIKNRAIKMFPLFFAALIAGRFMWFIPSIMALYLVMPPLQKICRKRPLLSLFLLMTIWAVTVYAVLGFLRPPFDIGIFLFRIPSMILGAYAVKLKGKLTRRRALIAGILLMAAGTALIWRFGYVSRLNQPFKGIFYLTGIPVVLGMVLILDQLARNGIPRFIERFGSMTLELYFSQMVLGTLLVNMLFRITDSRLMINALSITAIIAASAIVKKLNDKLLHFFS